MSTDNSQAWMDAQQIDRLRQRNLGKLLARALLAFETQVLDHMKERGYGIEPVYLPVVRNLDLAGNSITELAQRAGLAKQTVGPLVRQLEKKGILQVSVDPRDRRARVVRFTELGLKGLMTGLEGLQKVMDHYSRKLGEGRMNELLRLLEDLLEVQQE